MRVIVGVAAVVVMYVWGHATNFADVTLWVVLATLPVTVLFIVAYVPERPWRSWFGSSLLLLAFGVLAVCIAGAQLRLGVQWIGPNELGTAWIGFMWVAIVMRTWVLIAVQWRTRHGVGGLLRRAVHR